MGAIKDGLPVGSSRNKIEFLADVMDSMGAPIKIQASMPFYMSKDELVGDYGGEFAGFRYRFNTGDLQVGDPDYFLDRYKYDDSGLVLWPMADKIISQNSPMWSPYSAVLFGFQLELNIEAVFPEGYAPSYSTTITQSNIYPGKIQMYVGSQGKRIAFDWDDTERKMTIDSAAVGGVCTVFGSTPDGTAPTLNDALQMYSSPRLRFYDTGIPFDEAISVRAEGVIHIISAQYQNEMIID